jgi:hypothetical protein
VTHTGSASAHQGAALVGGPDAAQPKAQNEVCQSRVLGPDPGPTKSGRTAMTLPSESTADVKDSCVAHAECKARDHGRCVHQPEHEVHPFGQRRIIPAHNECVYDECTSDDECRRTSPYEPRAEQVCNCSPERNTCSFANCRRDSDCPSPFTCGPWRYCHSAADKCRVNTDCKKDQICAYSWEVKHYACKEDERIAPD